MDKVAYNSHFVPVGCRKNTTPVSANSVQAGARWIDAYNDATNKHDRYVQGGGGTFGVVSHMTLQTFPLPETLGFFDVTLTAKSDAAYQTLILKTLLLYRQHLNNQHWGENIIFQ